LSSFPLVAKKLLTISEYPSSPRSPHAAALKQLTSLVFKTLSPLEIKRRIKELVQLYFIKNNDQRKEKYLVAGRKNTVLSTQFRQSTCNLDYCPPAIAGSWSNCVSLKPMVSIA
jgi:hypothetical protein